MTGLVHPWVDFLLACLVAGIALRVRALSITGALAASLVGWAHATGGGILGAVALLVFFSTSTLLSKIGKRRKETLGFEKGGPRDHAQVLANGGVAACGAVWFGVSGGDGVAAAFLLGALATANADTWATEIGSLWGRNPRRITDWKPARSGESGAVSVAGTLAALSGSMLIATAGALVAGLWSLLPWAALAGFAGALFDSLLGATVQAMRRCPVCGARTEAHLHCGSSTEPVGGWAWMNNDLVNACATLFGALLATGLGLLIGG